MYSAANKAKNADNDLKYVPRIRLVLCNLRRLRHMVIGANIWLLGQESTQLTLSRLHGFTCFLQSKFAATSMVYGIKPEI